MEKGGEQRLRLRRAGKRKTNGKEGEGVGVGGEREAAGEKEGEGGREGGREEGGREGGMERASEREGEGALARKKNFLR